MMMLAFDIMGEVGYGQDFGGVVSGKEHPAAKAIHDHMSAIGTVGEYTVKRKCYTRIGAC